MIAQIVFQNLLEDDANSCSFEKFVGILYKAEEIRQKAKNLVRASCKVKRQLVAYCYDMMLYIIDLPFDKERLQLKGIKLIGDILVELKDYNNALFYYMKGVSFNVSLEILC